jgi:RNA polymerase sigma factor for flagellar operon FliA
LPALGSEDLAQNGFIAVLRAADRYDGSSGVPLGAYIQPRLMGSMRDSLRVESRQSLRALIPVRAPFDKRQAAFSGPPGEFERPIELAASGAPEPDIKIRNNDARTLLIRALGVLDDRERLIVVEVFFGERPQREVAEQLGLTPGRVCQIQKLALQKLRTELWRFGISEFGQVL